MLLPLDQELWVSRFAATLMRAQPRFPPRMAKEIGESVWPHLNLLRPEDSVQTVLDWALNNRQDDSLGLPSERA